MRSQARNRQKLFIAHMIKKEVDEYGNAKYDSPFSFDESLTAVDGDAEIIEYGDKVSKMYKSVVQRSLWEGKILENDVAYLEGANPFGEKSNGWQSNYVVKSVRYPTLNTMLVYFEKR